MCYLYVRIIILQNKVVLYPNPITAFIAIKSHLEIFVTVNIFDIMGKNITMQQHQLQIGNNELQLNVDALETGIYFVEISNGAEKIVQKLHNF